VSTPGRVEITVLGQTLSVRTEASPDYLRQLAAYLEERVSALTRSGMKDPLAAMTLAALDITDELFRARDDQHRQDGDVNQRIGALVDMLDRIAPGPAQPRRP
jgi:cell division protein ZapA (FtsZ GTPase activity inhibitor)